MVVSFHQLYRIKRFDPRRLLTYTLLALLPFFFLFFFFYFPSLSTQIFKDLITSKQCCLRDITNQHVEPFWHLIAPALAVRVATREADFAPMPEALA